MTLTVEPTLRARCMTIAEAGVNHNGSLEMALQLVDVARAAGADAVKFQVFKTEKVLSRNAPKAEYQKRTTDEQESFLEMGRKLELSYSAFETIHARCVSAGITFLASPFDHESLQFLVETLRVPRLKIASGEVTNGPLLLQAARSHKPIILSTGMSDPPEIEAALAVLAFGYTSGKGTPSAKAFRDALQSASGQQALRSQVTLLQCTTEYPVPVQDAHLLAMDDLRDIFDLPVGFSDHTEGIAVALAAVARGAVVIEKHFTLDRTLPGPDHLASLEPGELKKLVDGIRSVEAALGVRKKTLAASELKNKPIARRSLVAARRITKGEIFTQENLEAKRPGHGVSPMQYWDYLGEQADRDYEADDAIVPPAA